MQVNLQIAPLSQWGISFENKFIVAGPCSAETETQLLQTARALRVSAVQVMRAGIWKPRTRPNSFEGVGAEGLKWLKAVSREVGIPVAVEVATPRQVEECLEQDIDILWIGARTTPNPFAVQEIAAALQGTDIRVMVKNPVNADLQLWIGALERLNMAGVCKLMAVHRGFSSHDHNLYRNQPIWRIPLELKRLVPDLPLICDPSHICGRTDLIPSVAQKAMDLLFDGLMVEVHVDPAGALSDARQQLTPPQFRDLLQSLKYKQASSASRDYRSRIQQLRREIDAMDGRMLELLARRMEHARKIAVHKMKNNISIFQPERWDEVLKSRMKEGSELNLSEDFIYHMFQYIHEESIRRQEQVFNE